MAALELGVREKLSDLTTKATIIQHLIDTDSIEQPRIPEATVFAQEVFLKRFTSGRYFVEGLEHLKGAFAEVAEKRHEQKSQPTTVAEPQAGSENSNEKEKVVKPQVKLCLRHDGDSDHLIFRYIMEREGLGEEADNTVFAAGANMLKRRGIRVFMRAEHVIYIATPDDITNSRSLWREREKWGLSATEAEDAKQAHLVFSRGNEIADTRFGKVIDEGMNVAVYAEAGRPYDDLMKAISRYVAVGYFPNSDNVLIVPMRMYGSREFNPPNQIFRWYKFMPGLKLDVGLRIGPAYHGTEVWDWRKSVSQNPGDMLGAHMADVDTSQIRISDLIKYQKLMNIHHPDTNRIWLPNQMEELWEQGSVLIEK
jgi:hypothetical protein